ncbi:MAG: hypothetical protein IJD59_03910 [Clostridia bacterium]|nr:hypothetical protein [Clostridia bacterium]
MIYENEKLREISFPLGGIGTGSIGLAGNGSLIDFEIFNRPNKNSINAYTFFAVRAEYPDGRRNVRILQGDAMKDFSGFTRGPQGRGFGEGYAQGLMATYPHFRRVVFDGRFPIASLRFCDENFPGEVTLTAWNPMIPLDSENSSIPAAFFDIRLENGAPDVKYSVFFSVANPFPRTKNEIAEDGDFPAVTLRYADEPTDSVEYGDLTVAVDGKDAVRQEYWYRGGWQDPVSTFWYEMTRGTLTDRRYPTAHKADRCTVGASLAEGEKTRFVLSWNVPNNYNYWWRRLDENGRDVKWKNDYATRFADSRASAFYALAHYDAFFEKTALFRDTLHGSSLDPAVIDAISSTMSVLKSPTVLRLENGEFYGWEGVHSQSGSCEGTCTHVWSYAYALCFLFPDLERSIRDTEFRFDVEPNGKMGFRTLLPLGRGVSKTRACVDGSMLTVVKTYREWKISGDDAWLASHWQDVQKILAYAWHEENPDAWDRDRDGVLEGRQHHTLDMELFGPSSWLEGLYLAALSAAAEMAEHFGEAEKAADYRALFAKGFSYTKERLFNGKYFVQKVDLSEKAYVERFGCPEYWNEEQNQLKYQIADGCEIDQMLGQWHANLLGLGDMFDKEQRRTALVNTFRNNFKPSLREFANMWRVFAMNDEGGTVICDYPEGAEKPVIPIPYCEECMTGFEYAFAGLLISEGFVEEGLQAVRAIRGRYDGAKRNPWNEIECGNNYARAMASFALLPIFSGFTFDLPKRHIGFSPIREGDYRALWSLGTAWGNFTRTADGAAVDIYGGALTLSSLTLGGIGKLKALLIDGKEVPFTQEGDTVRWEETVCQSQIQAAYNR